jgi:hypothetical protein
MLPRNTGLVSFLVAMVLIVTCGPVLSVSAQTPPPVTTRPPEPSFAVTRDMAIAIATPFIPVSVQAKGSFYPGFAGNIIQQYVIVTFVIPSNVTRQELGWQEGPDTEFENTGYLPFDTFNELSFKIYGITGELILKKATDRKPFTRIIMGPYWCDERNPWQWPLVVASTLAAVFLIAFLLIMRRRRSSDAP